MIATNPYSRLGTAEIALDLYLGRRRPGLFALLVAALVVWWRRPPRPPDGPTWLPPYLREDLGLPPEPLAGDCRGLQRHPAEMILLCAWRQ